MRVYLAGPMRGIPAFNFPAFDAGAEDLRALGHEVFNPCDRDRNAHGNDVNDSATGDLGDVPQFDLRSALGDDLAWICHEADVVVVLPGWEKSKGATAEVSTAKALGLPVIELAEALGAEPESPRASALAEASALITGDRNNAYGPPTQDFKRSADMASGFGFRVVPHEGAEAVPLSPHHVAIFLILLKMSRLAWTPGKRDSWVDTAGYAGCGYECAVEAS